MLTPNRLLDLQADVGEVASTFIWELLDKSYNVIGQIHPALGASMDNNTTSQVMRAVHNVKIPQSERINIDVLRDRVRPSMVLQDGTVWPLGVFFFTSDQIIESTATIPFDTTLLDQRFLLTSTLPFSFGVSVGRQIRDAIIEVIQAVGITRYSVDASSVKVSGDPINWSPDVTGLTVLESLAQRCGFFPPYFDNDGTLILRAQDILQSGIGHQYSRQGGRIIVNSLRSTSSLLTAPNAYKVIGSGATQGEVSAIAYIDPSLPQSRERRGITIMKTIRLQGVGSNADALALAQANAREDVNQFSTAELTSAPDPRHDTFDIVQTDQELWREVGWAMEMKPGGAHSHQLVKKILQDG